METKTRTHSRIGDRQSVCKLVRPRRSTMCRTRDGKVEKESDWGRPTKSGPLKRRQGREGEGGQPAGPRRERKPSKSKIDSNRWLHLRGHTEGDAASRKAKTPTAAKWARGKRCQARTAYAAGKSSIKGGPSQAPFQRGWRVKNVRVFGSTTGEPIVPAFELLRSGGP